VKITIKVIGTSPLLMHNPQMVDPNFDLNRQIKALTAKRKKTDEDLADIERLEWYGGIYTEASKGGVIVVQPTSKLRKCLVESARISKAGKQVERGLSFLALNTPLIYDGPRDIDELWASGNFKSRLSVGMMGKRVMRVRPQFSSWAMSAPAELLTDVLSLEDLQAIASLAGMAVGIGDNRVNGYGRFTVEVTA